MLKQLSIKQLLLLAFLLAGLLPAMLVSFLSFNQTRTVLKQEITEDIQTLSATVAHDIERTMFERIRNIQSWSQLSIMQELKIGDVDKRLSVFLHGLALSYGNIYHEIYVEDLYGNIIAASKAKSIGKKSEARQEWFTTNSVNKRLTFSKIDQDVLAISQALFDDNTNSVMGQLVVEFNWQVVQKSLNNAIKTSTAAALFSENEGVLASTENWQDIVSQHGLAATSQLSDQSSITGWSVRIEKLRSDAVAPVHKLIQVK